MKRYRLAALVLLVISLAACAPARPAGPLVDYRRSGGLAGSDDHLVIEAGGRAILTRHQARHEFAVEPETLNRLTTLFDQAQFTALRGEYLPASNCCDLFDYVLTYQGHTVHTMDGAVPEALAPVLQALGEIITRSSPTPASG